MTRNGLRAFVREHGPALASMVAVLLLVHARELFLGQELAREDIGLAFYPWFRYIAQQRLCGNWLPWCPDIGCGHPLWANIQAGVFYPPNLLMMLPFSPPQLLATLYLLHYLWAAWGVYFLGRRFGLTRLPATVAGLIYAATGFMAAHENHYALVCTASWMPWVALGALNFATEGSRSGFALAAVGFACHFVCHPQPFMHTGAFVLGCVLVAGASERWCTGMTLRRLGLALLPLAVGVLLAGVQLVPTASLLASGLGEERRGLEFMRSFGLPARELISFVLPHTFGTVSGPYRGKWNFWETCGYIGSVSLLCMVLIGGRQRATRALYVGLALLGLGAVFMAMAWHNPLYLLLQDLPPFNQFRAPGRWLVVWSASGALLAGLCLHELRQGLTARRSMGLAATGFGAAGAASLVALGVSLHRSGRVVYLAEGVLQCTPRDWDLLIFGLGAALTFWGLIRPGPVRSVRWVALAMVAQSVAFSLYDAPRAAPGWHKLPASLVGKVPQRTQDGRLALVMLRPTDTESGAGVRATAAEGAVAQPPPEVVGLQANANLLNGVPVFNVYDPLTAPAQVLRTALGTRVLSPKVATSLGIRCILTNFAPGQLPGELQALAKVPGTKSGIDMYLYGNPGFAGLVWTATRFTGPQEAHSIIRDETRAADFLLDAPCVLPEPEGIAATDGRRGASVTQWDGRGIAVQVADGPPCALIITSVRLPGWSATVNGAPADLRVANGVFCAVTVPAGPAQVRLSYSPYGLEDGARVSAAGLVLLLLVLAVPRRRS
jgi:hypothetical protein